MRIALVHLRHAESGGTERYMNGLARHLARAGADVSLICRRHGAAPDPGVRFVRLHGSAFGAARRTEVFDREVAAHLAVETYDVVFSLGRTTCHDLVRLGGGCQATYLELAHDATLAPWERVLGVGRAKQRTNLALEARGLAPDAYQRVVVNAELVARDVMARFGVPRERLDVIHNGVDLERFHPRLREVEGAALREELGLEQGARVLLFLGNGYGRKGLDVVLEAWRRFAPTQPGWQLLVVGADARLAELRSRARSAPGGERTCFAGPRADAERCFAAADLYVLPTRYDPFANSTLEAMAAGLPVVTSSANGGCEVLGPQSGAVIDAALLAEPERAGERLAQELVAWSDPERLAAGALAARRDAERHPLERKLAASAALLRESAERNAGRPTWERFAARLAELGLGR